MSSVIADTAPSTAKWSDEFLPPPYPEPHVRRQLDECLREVEEIVAPVWPLKDYVAVNPYGGLSDRSFAEAGQFLRLFSDCTTLMPLTFFAKQWQQGKFGISHLAEAIDELGLGDELSPRELVGELVELHEKLPADAEENSTGLSRATQWLRKTFRNAWSDATQPLDPPPAASRHHRLVRTIAEVVQSVEGKDWPALIREEITKHCSAHYDQGEAIWGSDSKHLPLYQAWRARAVLDFTAQWNGLSGFRSFVGELPHTADATIVMLLQRLGVPQAWWQTFLLCQAYSIAGWSAWTRYQSQWKVGDETENQDFIGLLAIRLAYDCALSEARAINIGWNSLAIHHSETYAKTSVPREDTNKRLALLRAMEIANRDVMVIKLLLDGQPMPEEEHTSQRRMAQIAFCIDVRSERIRRHLESTHGEIETFGFAGFFAMPIKHVPLGSDEGDAHVPVLLQPEFSLTPGWEGHPERELRIADQQRSNWLWRKRWKRLRNSVLGCFPFVETTGVVDGGRLLSRIFGSKTDTAATDCNVTPAPAPTVSALHREGVTTDGQADLAEGLLRNLGLVDNFARLVVFCGHASQTSNNPLAAALDCGACGGHSGQPNAQLAALLLNEPAVRTELQHRGIHIPSDTHFLAALHNTTTDQLQFFKVDEVPPSHLGDLQEFIECCETASELTRQERRGSLGSPSTAELKSRASDWSEVRPEWGLAGNTSMLIAPRHITRSVNLQGASFLHSYRCEQDPDGSVLETIMNGPMVVAHWINMQYYASTVDPKHFGSGYKTIHNVVGQFGILSGASGDLMTGLPWQSVHDGSDYRHQPLRLQVLIAAKREKIEAIIERNQPIANLLRNQWLHLSALDGGAVYHWSTDGTWVHACSTGAHVA